LAGLSSSYKIIEAGIAAHDTATIEMGAVIKASLENTVLLRPAHIFAAVSGWIAM
jgi:hypothetical protein